MMSSAPVAIKGHVTADLLAPALGVSSDEAARLLDRLAADRIVAGSSGMFSLSADGKAIGSEMLAGDREAFGVTTAAAPRWLRGPRRAHEETIVTAWQLKEVGGQQVLNDHADAAYDAAVLAELAALDAMPRLGSGR